MSESSLQRSSPKESLRTKPVAVWLLAGVAMVMIQILLGGITRLTGSGLSITEWNVVTGTLPPLSEQQWLAEFDKYKQTPQFQLLNFEFTLKEFKFIFFWEWLHRFWARLMVVVFVVPFIIFLVQRRFRSEMIKPMIILFLLGALQGAVGWIMVASGLTGDAIYVKPTRLAIHFILALALLCYTFWFALQLVIPKQQIIINKALRNFIWLVIFVLCIQFIYGALMAGHKAATAAPTWPDINGAIVPDNLFRSPEGGLSLIDNKITIHFIHRSLAYVLIILVAGLTWRTYGISSSRLWRKTKWLPMLLISLQVVLGIFSVFTSLQIVPGRWGIFEWMAQLHQLTAMLLLLSLVWMLFLIRTKN